MLSLSKHEGQRCGIFRSSHRLRARRGALQDGFQRVRRDGLLQHGIRRETLVDRVLSVAARLRETGAAVLLVEQLVEKALALADRVYALARGRIVLAVSASEPDLPHRLERAYFGHDVLTTRDR